MAIFSQRSSSWIFSLKVILLSTGVLSMALVLKLSVPLLLDFLAYEIPLFWTTLLSWLTPPYLYFVINGIIITIAASSRFQHEEMPMMTQIGANFEVLPVAAYGELLDVRVSEREEEDFAISRSDCFFTRGDSFVTEKPLVSTRFGHRKSVKASPEGYNYKALGVSRPKRNETLESTWKTITDGRPIPLARHLKKSDTWETHARPSSPVMKKSETVKDRRSSPSSGKLKKEPSLSQDELNRRVEAFIKKFNEEIRLQRQESFKHYKDMVNRGSH
ncbi:uncharacterized protein LOC143846532 [Tasmannia lanceolata]|uniref:uncharacterized protein LOC143846532 n=1 Tax=Tasmannia lanceolata TaxID=3420 RepID=UPI0040640D10